TAPIGRTRGSGGPRRALRGMPSPSLVGNPRTVHTDAMRKIMISGLHPLGWMLLAAACNTADGGRGSGDASEGTGVLEGSGTAHGTDDSGSSGASGTSTTSSDGTSAADTGTTTG